MTVIYKKELRRLLGGFLAYGAIAVLLLAYGFYTSYGNLFLAYTDITNTLVGSFYALLVALPMVTCGLYAYEYRSKGTGLLYSLGFTPTQIVLGKLLAALTVVGFALGVLALTPVFISFFGEVDRTLCYFSWLGYLLLTVALTALCAFLSAFWKRAWVAFLVSMGAMVLLWLLNLILTALPVAAWFSFVIVELLLLGPCCRRAPCGNCVGCSSRACCRAVYPEVTGVCCPDSPCIGKNQSLLPLLGLPLRQLRSGRNRLSDLLCGVLYGADRARFARPPRE